MELIVLRLYMFKLGDFWEFIEKYMKSESKWKPCRQTYENIQWCNQKGV